MFQTLNLVCDNSTLANFKSWAQSISSWFSTVGWLQSADTGQVNWTTISAVPGANSFVYEIWEPNDSLTNFFLKVEYGNTGSTNSPSVRVSIGTATNGAGVLTGEIVGTFVTVFNQPITAPSASILYPCYFSGEAGRISILMWRTAPNNAAQVIAVERSINGAGAYTGSHVTLMVAGASFNDGGVNFMPYSQQSLLFGVGAAPAQSIQSTNQSGGLCIRAFLPGGSANSDFNGAIPFDTTAPVVGLFDFPLTSLGWGNSVNYTDGQIFTTTLYGATRTYVATNTPPLSGCGPHLTQGVLCVRYD